MSLVLLSAPMRLALPHLQRRDRLGPVLPNQRRLYSNGMHILGMPGGMLILTCMLTWQNKSPQNCYCFRVKRRPFIPLRVVSKPSPSPQTDTQLWAITLFCAHFTELSYFHFHKLTPGTVQHALLTYLFSQTDTDLNF